MEGENPDPANIVSYAIKTWNEASGESEKTKDGGTSSSLPTVWSPPARDFLKVNVDAGSVRDMGSGLGAIIRDSDGQVCACATWQGRECWEVVIAEAKAVVFGLKLANEVGARRLVEESDCLTVIQSFREAAKGTSAFHMLLDDILELSSTFDDVIWSFVRREGNKIAHELAHFQPFVVYSPIVLLNLLQFHCFY
ncbi:uncharacterized protein LOC110696153 [Chenopodium quinoa]|uniref:uncharacterized protein LOC110696153 n=1 Tax=Chenopodium quinoa TaxID=63459 RepID=UPI000B784665|nr:uncharacterized protein LOC110696153 [Chenopodium quinoa]